MLFRALSVDGRSDSGRIRIHLQHGAQGWSTLIDLLNARGKLPGQSCGVEFSCVHLLLQFGDRGVGIGCIRHGGGGAGQGSPAKQGTDENRADHAALRVLLRLQLIVA